MELARDTLTSQAFDALLQQIVDQGLKPGDELPSTAELTRQLGVSRPVVREALSALRVCGFINISSGRNATVAQLDGRLVQMFVGRAARMHAHPMSALMEMRLPLEVQAATLAARRGSAGAIDGIVDANQQMRASLHDSDRYPGLDTRFHAQIATATENYLLIWITQSIRAELTEVMQAVRQFRDDHHLVGQEQEQHDLITDAIRRHAVDEATSAMRNHIELSIDMVHQVEHEMKTAGTRPHTMDRWSAGVAWGSSRHHSTATATPANPAGPAPSGEPIALAGKGDQEI